MTLEDYIREQERKARDEARDIKSAAQDAWTETKKAARDIRDKSADAING